MRILLGEISSYKAIVIAKYLKKSFPDCYLMAYDYKKAVKACHTKYVDLCVFLPYSKKDGKDAYVSVLSQCVAVNNIDVLIPVHSDFFGAILEYKELFGHTLDYLGGFEEYSKLHNKDVLIPIAGNAGVRVPETYKSIEEAVIPFVVKPTNLSSSKGVRYCFNEKDKQQLLSEGYGNSYICQEYIPGKGCGYEVYCIDGKITREYGHIRLAEYPISGGSSIYRAGFIHPDMRLFAERILQQVPWTGFAMFEFKLTPGGDLVLIEVNPRIWGSIHQALANGCRLFDFIKTDGSINKEIRCVKASDTRTCLTPQIYLSLLQYLFKGNTGIIKEYINNRKRTIKDVDCIDDAKGMLSMFLRKL